MTSRLTAVLASEWTKLTSTRTLAVCAWLALGLSVAVTAMLAMAMSSAEDVCSQPGRDCGGEALRPDVLVATVGMIGDGTPGPGLSVLMVLAALVVCVEHRYRTIGTTYMVTPRRPVVLVAKMVIAVAVAFVVGLLAILGSAAVFQVLGGRATEAYDPVSGTALHMYATVPVVAMISVVIAVAVASLVRSSVVAVTLVVAWPSIGEPLLSAVPGIGPTLAPALPFVNARNFIGLEGGAALSWGWGASGLYFAVVATVLVAAALVHQSRSDVPTT